jgi:hypothetical protein
MDKKNILVQDSQGTTLGSFNFENRDQAFELACQLEEMGIDAKIVEPSLPETLISSLGASTEDKETLKKEIEDEIEDHGEDCCRP